MSCTLHSRPTHAALLGFGPPQYWRTPAIRRSHRYHTDYALPQYCRKSFETNTEDNDLTCARQPRFLRHWAVRSTTIADGLAQVA